MREIKFRGKRVDNGEWVYGDLYRVDVFGEILTLIGEATTYQVAAPPVDPATVGQYTGLKDSKGVEIFEGDNVSFTYWWFDGNVAETQLEGTIVYSEDLMSFQLKGVKNDDWEKHTGYVGDEQYLTPFSELNFEEADFEVIGEHAQKEATK